MRVKSWWYSVKKITVLNLNKSYGNRTNNIFFEYEVYI